MSAVRPYFAGELQRDLAPDTLYNPSNQYALYDAQRGLLHNFIKKYFALDTVQSVYLEKNKATFTSITRLNGSPVVFQGSVLTKTFVVQEGYYAVLDLFSGD